MAYFSVKDYAKKIQSEAYFAAITCKFEDCPLFKQCSQFASMGRKYGRKPIKLFIVFEYPNQDDVNSGAAAVSKQGQYFREKWLNLFLSEAGAQSYLITHLVRTPLTDAQGDARSASAAEAAYCWEHFWTDLMEYKPDVLVTFGASAFQQLYKKAKNKELLPDPDSHGVGKLRLNPMTLQFTEDYKPTVYVGYAPGYILRSPASASHFIEDCYRVINHYCPNKKDLSKQEIKVDKIDRIDTVSGAIDFIDFLARGLPSEPFHLALSPSRELVLPGASSEFFDLAFDTETDNLNRSFNNRFLSWQFSYKPGHAVFIPIDHPARPIFADIKDKLKLIAAFQSLLNSSPEQTRIAWILAHNAKFDLSVLWGLYRILPRGSIPIWDTQLAMHWLDENRKGMGAVLDGKPYSLKTLGKECFNFNYKSEALAARADGELVNLNFDDLVEYGGSDTILTWHLKQKQMCLAKLQPDDALPKLERFMRYYYSPASRAIAFMECNGIHVSKEQLQYLQGEESPIWNRIERIENVELQNSPEVVAFREKYKRIIKGESNVNYEDDLWGEDDTAETKAMFNPNKKDQETAFYLNHLQLEPLEFSKKTKKATLNKEFLNHYATPEVYQALPEVEPYREYYKKPIAHDEDGDPVFPKNPLQLILEYRELSKLGNTYLENIGEMIGNKNGDCIDGRVRASYWLAGTDTGRLCLRYDSRISVVGDFANLTPPIPPVKHGIPIKDVKVGDLVYCYDNEGNLQIKKVLWQGKTGTRKLLRIHWSAANNRKTGHLDLTPEHKVRLLDGSYKMAKDLKPDDHLLTMARCVVKTNSNKKNYYSKIYTQKTMLNEHRFVHEKINGSKVQTVHHADGNSLNNHPDNLVATTTSKHTSEHLKEHWENGVFADRPTKGEGHYLWNHQGRFTFLKELARVKGHRKSAEGLANKNMIKNSASFKRRCQLFGIDSRVIRMRYDGHGVYISKGRLQRLLATEKSAKIVSDLKIDYRTLKALLSYYGQEHLIAQRPRDSEGRKHSVLRNHVVIKIEELPGYHDVYDLEVDDCHNFIANEICVHNSSSEPNLQNLPSGKSKMAKEVKNLFQAEAPSKKFPEGTALIQLDYKTAEVRWAAIFANDRNLIRLFNEAREALIKACASDCTMTEEEFEKTQLASDIHRRTASLMFGVPPGDVSKSQRQASKCLVGSTRVFTDRGIVPIDSLVFDSDDSNWLQKIDINIASYEKTQAIALNHKWVDNIVSLDTKIGISIQGDMEHELLVWENCQLTKKTMADIREGDFLIIPRTNSVWPQVSPRIECSIENEQNEELVTTVTCLLCGKEYGNLNTHIPSAHNWDLASYKKAYPHAPLVSPQQIVKRMNSLLGSKHNILVPKWPTFMTTSLAKILGYLVAEGDGQRYTMSGHADKSDEMLKDFISCFYQCFGVQLSVTEYQDFTTTGIIRMPQKILRYLVKLGLLLGYSETQRVPEIIFRSTREEIAAFLSAYFEGDGGVKSNNQIVAVSASSQLIEDLQYLLLSLNIVSTSFTEDRLTPVGKENRHYYGLRLSVRDARLFNEQIGFISSHKRRQAAKISQLSPGRDYIYGLEALLTQLKQKYKHGRRWVVGNQYVRFGERITKGGESEITHERLESRPYVLEALNAWSILENNSVYRDVAWLHANKAALIPVVSKTVQNEKTKVYDLEVTNDTHTFIANGFLSQNCITFGLTYGMGTETLADNNGWTVKEAEEKVALFFSAFPELRRWLDANPRKAKANGYVETIMGRRRRLDFLFATNDFRNDAKASRLAMNAPIQGQSSDGGTIGLFQFLQYLLDNNLEKRWIIQNVVHDSCLVQVPMNDLEKALVAMQYQFVDGMAEYIKQHFNFTLPLPIECEIEVGLKYGDLVKWDGRPSTLPSLIAKLKADAQTLWYTKKEKTGKPSKDLDLVHWQGK